MSSLLLMAFATLCGIMGSAQTVVDNLAYYDGSVCRYFANSDGSQSTTTPIGLCLTERVYVKWNNAEEEDAWRNGSEFNENAVSVQYAWRNTSEIYVCHQDGAWIDHRVYDAADCDEEFYNADESEVMDQNSKSNDESWNCNGIDCYVKYTSYTGEFGSNCSDYVTQASRIYEYADTVAVCAPVYAQSAYHYCDDSSYRAVFFSDASCCSLTGESGGSSNQPNWVTLKYESCTVVYGDEYKYTTIDECNMPQLGASLGVFTTNADETCDAKGYAASSGTNTLSSSSSAVRANRALIAAGAAIWIFRMN